MNQVGKAAGEKWKSMSEDVSIIFNILVFSP